MKKPPSSFDGLYLIFVVKNVQKILPVSSEDTLKYPSWEFFSCGLGLVGIIC